ncbi:MAG: glycosyltransferase family 4 protein [Chloroflexi bacterium]|nr:glycosyltransferase family 4 protein [Chloroflexota bacterium]
MRILLLLAESPLPLTNGVRLRTYHLLSALVRKHEISLLSFYHSTEDMEGLKQMASRVAHVEAVRGVDHASFLDYVRGSISPTPFYVERGKGKDMQVALARQLESHEYDLLFVSDVRMAHYAIPYRSIPRLIDACDASSLSYRRGFYRTTHLLQRIHFLQLWLKMQRYESKMYSLFDLCTVVSPVDAATLQKNVSGLNVAVVPNGVDSGYFRPGECVLEREASLIFVGRLDYPPNVDAVRHFVNHIFPHVRRQVPSAHFVIVGRNGSQESLGLRGAANVEVVGAVPDIRPFVWENTAFVCPLRFGSGVKNKVLEAMAMAKPVVGTPIACEGLDLVPGEHIMVASSTADTVGSIIDLFSDSQKRVQLGLRAREVVETKYSWAAAADRLDALIEEVVARWTKLELRYPAFTPSRKWNV